MKLVELSRFPGRFAVAAAVGSLVACSGEDPTQVVVDSDYPPVADDGLDGGRSAADGLDGGRSAADGDPATEMTVYKVWWVTTLLPDPVAPGQEGQVQRTVPGADHAYAVLAPGWDPSSGTPPTRFIAARSTASLGAARGTTLHVHVSDATFDGNCAAGRSLTQDEADLITQRIFPAEFAGIAYDAATCTAAPAVDAGASDAAPADGSPSSGD
jgi:hypothetical protein